MIRPSELRQRAERYRRLQWQITDAAVERAAADLADELETTATEMERRLRIRERAHALWIEHGRPHGRDEEFWLAAEREVDSRRRR
jgi:hypothetical protein